MKLVNPLKTKKLSVLSEKPKNSFWEYMAAQMDKYEAGKISKEEYISCVASIAIKNKNWALRIYEYQQGYEVC